MFSDLLDKAFALYIVVNNRGTVLCSVEDTNFLLTDPVPGLLLSCSLESQSQVVAHAQVESSGGCIWQTTN